jgi:hypothetical protein
MVLNNIRNIGRTYLSLIFSYQIYINRYNSPYLSPSNRKLEKKFCTAIILLFYILLKYYVSIGYVICQHGGYYIKTFKKPKVAIISLPCHKFASPPCFYRLQEIRCYIAGVSPVAFS